MKKKKRSIPVYADNRIMLTTTLSVEVDDNGDAWLTPEQVVYLENAYLWGRYSFSQPLRASKHIIEYYELPPTTTSDVFDATIDRRLIRSTPAFNGATI